MNTIREYIDHHAAKTPERIFLLTPGEESQPYEQLSFQALKDRTDLLGCQLSNRGFKPQSKVALLMKNSQWAVITLLAAMAHRHTIVPLNPAAGEAHMLHAFDHCDADVIFISSEYLSMVENLIASFDRCISVIVVDELRGPLWNTDLNKQVAANAHDAAASVGDDQALLLYTSGSTGVAKGAMLMQVAVVNSGRNVVRAHELTHKDRVLCVLPLNHVSGAIEVVVASLVCGGSLVVPQSFNTDLFWPLVAEYECTWSSVSPVIVKSLLDNAALDEIDFGNESVLEQFRFAQSALAPLPAHLLAQWEETFCVPVIDTLSLAETAGTIASNPQPPGIRKPGSVGCAVGCEIEIADPDGVILPAEAVGEVLVRGESVCKEYYKNQQAFAESFKGGWFKTGDLGVKDRDGYLFLIGRISELIVCGGEYLLPEEIDRVLNQHEAVLEAAAFALDDAQHGQQVCAAIVLRAGYSCDEEALIQFCEAAIGEVPKKVIFLDQLPKGPAGNVLRYRLAELSGSYDLKE